MIRSSLQQGQQVYALVDVVWAVIIRILNNQIICYTLLNLMHTDMQNNFKVLTHSTTLSDKLQ